MKSTHLQSPPIQVSCKLNKKTFQLLHVYTLDLKFSSNFFINKNISKQTFIQILYKQIFSNSYLRKYQSMYRKHSTNEKQNLKRVLDLETNALITDFKYNHNGTKIAVSDSEGNVFVYLRNTDQFVKSAQFKADDAALLKISWADPHFGEILAIGSFKKKVSVFQNKNNKWSEIAKHQHHQGSVNHVEWAPAAYGIKLYSAGSDGMVCIFEVRKNNWQLGVFPTHQTSINSLAIKPVPLNEQNQGLQNLYPTIATISKDLMLRVWRHPSQAKHLKLDKVQNYQQGSYAEVACIKPHSELTRTILFKPVWNEDDEFPSYSIISGSQDGRVKLSAFKKDELSKDYVIHQGQSSVVSLSLSLTGKNLLVGVASHSQQTTLLYVQKQKGEWEYIQQQQ